MSIEELWSLVVMPSMTDRTRYMVVKLIHNSKSTALNETASIRSIIIAPVLIVGIISSVILTCGANHHAESLLQIDKKPVRNVQML